MSMISFYELILLFAMGLVSIPVPLSVPPLPEDPKLLRAAPTDSIAYFSWAGRAKPNRESKNKTERLAAEPQMQSLVLAVSKALRKAWEIEARDDAELAGECFHALALAAERPGCVFVSGVDVPPKPFSIRAGLVANLGARGALLVPTLRKLEAFLVEEMTRGNGEVATIEPLPGLKFRSLPMPQDAPAFSWGIVDGYLVLALGEGMPKTIASGLRGGEGMSAHAVFKEAQSKIRVARPCFRTFVDLQKIVTMAKASGGEEVAQVLKVLGLDGVQAVLSESGLESDGFMARSMLLTKSRTGILGLLDGPPLASKELAVIPGDATFASALRVSPKILYTRIKEMVAAIDPRSAEQFESEIAGGVQQATGLDLEKDLLAHIGDTLSAWNSPGQGGLLFSGLTVALELDDSAAFARSFDKVMGTLREMMPPKQADQRGRVRRGVYLDTIPAPGTKIYFVNTVGDEMPFAPAWCVTSSHLMISLFPQMLKANIARGNRIEGSLAIHPRVRALPGAVAITHIDGPAIFDSIYAALHPLAQLACAELQREGLDLHIGLLPTADSIRPHIAEETSSLTVRPDGFLLTRKGSIPVLDPVVGMAMPMISLVPYLMVQRQMVEVRRREELQRARQAAQQAERRQKQEEEKKKQKNRKKNGLPR